MRPLIELITEWDSFSADKETATVEKFCRYYLAKSTKPTPEEVNQSFQLSRTLGRVAAIQRTCLKLVLKEKLNLELEWYYFLHTISTRKATRKTDIISISLLLEPTTGIDILNRMIKSGLLVERTDPSDKRARLLSMTKEGKLVLQRADRLAQQIAALLFADQIPAERTAMESALLAIENTFGKTLIDKDKKQLSAEQLLKTSPLR